MSLTLYQVKVKVPFALIFMPSNFREWNEVHRRFNLLRLRVSTERSRNYLGIFASFLVNPNNFRKSAEIRRGMKFDLIWWVVDNSILKKNIAILMLPKDRYLWSFTLNTGAFDKSSFLMKWGKQLLCPCQITLIRSIQWNVKNPCFRWEWEITVHLFLPPVYRMVWLVNK